MDDLAFRKVLPSAVWRSPTQPTRVVNTSLQAYGRDFRHGLLLGEFDQGKGRLVVSTPSIVPHLMTDPVADRVLKNMMVHYSSSAAGAIAR